MFEELKLFRGMFLISSVSGNQIVRHFDFPSISREPLDP